MINSLGLQQIHQGVTFGFYARSGYYSSSKAREEVDEMVKTGVKWVVLVVTVMQEGFAATRQFRDFVNTPNDIELKEIIDYIHSKGIKVQLRPMLECFDGKGRLAVTFPADGERIPGLTSEYCSKWFDSMEKRSVYYARIAEMTGCEMYCLDSELDRIISFNNQWKSVLAKVREVYSGPVTSCHTIHTGVIDFEAVLSDKKHWFYELDMLSISDYAKAANDAGRTVEQMVESLKPRLELHRRIARIYGKPILFGEVGCTSSAGGAISPSGWKPTSPYSGEEQSNYLEAVMETYWNEPWWYGIYWWKWDEQNDRPEMKNDPSGDKGFTVRGKPAQETMRKWFTRTDIER